MADISIFLTGRLYPSEFADLISKDFYQHLSDPRNHPWGISTNPIFLENKDYYLLSHSDPEFNNMALFSIVVAHDSLRIYFKPNPQLSTLKSSNSNPLPLIIFLFADYIYKKHSNDISFISLNLL